MATSKIGTKEEKYLLWTHPSGGGSLSAQTINLPISDYSEIEIWFSSSGWGWYVPYRMKTSVTAERQICVPRGEFLGIRAVTLSANSISFGAGYYYPAYGNYQSTVGQAAVCTPVKIYGIK